MGNPSHPAWATEYDVDANTFRAMDVVTNSFCAGGSVLGNGTWLNVGGNQGTVISVLYLCLTNPSQSHHMGRQHRFDTDRR